LMLLLMTMFQIERIEEAGIPVQNNNNMNVEMFTSLPTFCESLPTLS